MIGALAGAFLIVVLALAGCGRAGGADDDTSTTDAGPSWTVEVPRIPWLAEGTPPIAPPDFGGCSGGWRPIEVAGATVCEPWPEGGRAECALGEAHFPGEPGCRPLDAPCPADDFAVDLPTDRPVLFVRPGAAGGDGTRDRPYGTLAEALALRPSGGALALSKGRFTGEVNLARITIFGACAAETIIESTTASPTQAVLNIRGPDVELHDVRIEARGRAGIHVALGGVVLRGVESNAHLIAVGPGATVDADGVALRGVPISEADVRLGAVQLTRGAVATLRHAVIEGGRAAAAIAIDSQLTLNDVAVEGALHPVQVAGTSRLVVSRLVLEDLRRNGALAVTDGSIGDIQDLVVRRSGSRTLVDNAGVYVTAAELTARRVWIDQHAGLAVVADESGSISMDDAVVSNSLAIGSLTVGGYAHGCAFGGARGAVLVLNRVVIRAYGNVAIDASEGTRQLSATDVAISDGFAPIEFLPHQPRGIQADGSEVLLERVEIARAEGTAVLVHGGTLVARDVHVADLRPFGARASGWGIGAYEGATVDLLRTVVEGHWENGITIEELDTSLRAEDIVVRDPSSLGPMSADGFGWGIAIGLRIGVGTTADVTRALFERNGNASLDVRSDPLTPLRATFRDLVVRDTQNFGVGLVAVAGTVDVQRALFERNASWGIAALGGDVEVRLDQVRISDTVDRFDGAFGLVAATSARVHGRDVDVARAATCGVIVDGPFSQLDLETSTLRESPIGACIQAEEFDIARISNGVLFRDNGRNIVSSTYVIPPPPDVPPVPPR